MICLTAVYQWAPLHFPCIRQKVNRRWNSRYRYETAAIDHSWLSSGTAMWSLGMRAVCAIGQFPAIQKRIIYCLAIKTSMFRNQGFFYHTRWILRFPYFSIHKGLKCQHLVRPKYYEFGQVSPHPPLRNGVRTMNLRDGLEHDMCIQSGQTCRGQFGSGQCPAGGCLMGWLARSRKVYTQPKRHNLHNFFFFFFIYILECESSGRLVF